jgi:murein DD-endopeptidase MepM/ murein hydrolase activator NlpD
MRNGVPRQSISGVALVVSAIFAAAALSGCTTMRGAFSDPMVTGATNTPLTVAENGQLQAMPQSLSSSVPPSASAKYIPPADVGPHFPGMPVATNALPASGPVQGGIVSQDLPSLRSSSEVGSTQSMPLPLSTASNGAAASQPAQTLATPPGGYTHIIESGESLRSIARKYDVAVADIIDSNNISSPDRIFVGQKLVIPGASKAAPVAANDLAPKTASKPAALQQLPTKSSPVRTQVASASPAAKAPESTASVPKAEAASPSQFRWPASGKVTIDFAASKGTGINIEVPEGSAIRAAESGTVIYVGNAVEGYGNLILVKHDNGYVSAYAHLSEITVSKGDAVSRGDTIGLAGMTGSVSRPQLHFELRKGATPVDPVPMLAS